MLTDLYCLLRQDHLLLFYSSSFVFTVVCCSTTLSSGLKAHNKCSSACRAQMHHHSYVFHIATSLVLDCDCGATEATFKLLLIL